MISLIALLLLVCLVVACLASLFLTRKERAPLQQPECAAAKAAREAKTEAIIASLMYE